MDTRCSCRRPVGPMLVLLAILTLPSSLASQDVATTTVEYPAGFDEEAELYPKALGPFTRPITTDAPRAQSFFDQGVQLMYSFSPLKAARSFRQAQVEDPNCAMCFWGEAWAWGPYLNGGMGPDDAPRAHENIKRAEKLAGKYANDAERALIEAMAVRYAQAQDDASRKAMDSTYANAMREVYHR